MSLALWVLSLSSLWSLVASFTTIQGTVAQQCVHATSRRAVFVSGRTRQPVRLLNSRQQIEQDIDNVASKSVSDFGQTSGPVKAFVGGLTDLFVSFSSGKEESGTSCDAASKVCT